MKQLAIAICILIGVGVWHGARADDQHDAKGSAALESCRTDGKGDKQERAGREPKAEASVTEHHLSAGGKSFDYTATAGTLVIRDDDGKPMANIGYVAYTRRDPKGGALQRPLMFAFNGGPGSSSMLLHMGLLGPKRALVADPGAAPPPAYKTIDNEFSMLDKADLVMIDPVGTGFSRAVCDKKEQDFTNVDADVDSINRFIVQYLSDHDRWTSPKYLIGESYGSTRAAALVNYARAHDSVTFNGVVLISMATDMELVATGLPGNERPYPAFLPGFAAVAWYHHLVAGQPPALVPFLEEVRRYAAGPFTAALLEGDALPDNERDAVAEQVHKYTGLSAEYIKAANLRVSEFAFAHELLKSQHKMVGRLDGRFVGLTLDPLQKNADYDPALAAVDPIYTAALQDYYRADLKFGSGQIYLTRNAWIGDHFQFRHTVIGNIYAASLGEQPMVNSGVDLAQALVQEANLRVLVLSGYFDLGSPFTVAEYMVSHLGVPKEAAARVEIKYYEAGHMMYVNTRALEKVKHDLDAFVDSTH